MSRERALAFFVSIALATLLIAGTLTLQGFWPVLPFAGLELFVLGMALGWSMRRGSYCEVISVTDGRITVERGQRDARERVEFDRHWASVELRRSANAWYPSRLLLGSHGRRIEIGAVLTEGERVGLAARLTQLVGPPNSLPPMKAGALAEADDGSSPREGRE